jgi:hypothetical protein
VFKSLPGINASQFSSRRALSKWWVHELARVFGDRIDLKESTDLQVKNMMAKGRSEHSMRRVIDPTITLITIRNRIYCYVLVGVIELS